MFNGILERFQTGLMPAFVFSVFWLNVLLIVGVMLRRLSELGARLSALQHAALEGRLLCGRLAKGDGPEGSVAELRIDQIGRADRRSRTPQIVFHDRGRMQVVHGGVWEGEGGLRVRIDAASRSLELWTTAADRAQAARAGMGALFTEGYAQSQRPRGFVRSLALALRAGDEAWISLGARPEGSAVESENALAITLLASEDPRRQLVRKMLLIGGAATGCLALAFGLTALAMSAPLESAFARGAGGAALVFFLLVQPFGVTIRDLVEDPWLAPVRGEWRG